MAGWSRRYGPKKPAAFKIGLTICSYVKMRIAISSKNRLFREGLASILKGQEDCVIVAQSTSAQAALKTSGYRRPQVLIIDRAGAERGDLDYALGARLYQNFGIVLIAGPGMDVAGFEKVVRYDKSGYELVNAVRSVKSPDIGINRRRRGVDPADPLGLTARERQLAELAGQGLSSREIAEATGLKQLTAKNTVARIMHKLGCNNRVQLAHVLAGRGDEEPLARSAKSG